MREERLDRRDADAGEALRERVRPQDDHRADGVVGERLARRRPSGCARGSSEASRARPRGDRDVGEVSEARSSRRRRARRAATARSTTRRDAAIARRAAGREHDADARRSATSREIVERQAGARQGEAASSERAIRIEDALAAAAILRCYVPMSDESRASRGRRSLEGRRRPRRTVGRRGQGKDHRPSLRPVRRRRPLPRRPQRRAHGQVRRPPLRAPPASVRDRPRTDRRHRARRRRRSRTRCSPRSTPSAPQGIEIGENLLLSDRAQVILPWHRLLDAAREQRRRRREDRNDAARHRPGVRVRRRAPGHPRRGPLPSRDPRPPRRARWRRRSGPCSARSARRDVPDAGAGPRRASPRPRRGSRRTSPTRAATCATTSRRGGTLLAEGAHGAMLDLSAGTYPFVTSSTCTSAGVAAGSPDLAARARRLARRPEGLHDARRRRPVPDGAPRRDRRVPPQARQRVRHLDGPPAPDRLVRRRRRAHRRRALGRRRRRDHEARRPGRPRRDPRLRRLPLDGREIEDVPALVEDVERLEPVYEVAPGWKSGRRA